MSHPKLWRAFAGRVKGFGSDANAGVRGGIINMGTRFTHTIGRAAAVWLVCAGALAAQSALANSANTSVVSGTVGGQVAAPTGLVAVNALRFGTFAQPVVGGTMVMAPQSTFTTTGDLGTASSIIQSSARGAASFTVAGSPGAAFGIYGVSSVTISNGSAKMTVGQFTTDAFLAIGQLSTSGTASFNIGGTLTASANQAPGTYTGTFPITVQYY